MERQRLDELIARLPERHRIALEWFATRAGTEHPWPNPLPNGTLLASKAKGIFKPRWTKYALSVRQSLGGPYPDREPVRRPDSLCLLDCRGLPLLAFWLIRAVDGETGACSYLTQSTAEWPSKR